MEGWNKYLSNSIRIDDRLFEVLQLNDYKRRNRESFR